MIMNKHFCIAVISVLLLTNQLVQCVTVPQNTNLVKTNELSADTNVVSRQPRGWMEMASNAIAGPAGQLVVHFAKEMMSRQDGSSQVTK